MGSPVNDGGQWDMVRTRISPFVGLT